jgi:hypothetical protein
MKCTNCLTVMECISAINPVPNQPGRDRMDLHCVKPNSWGGRGCDVRCHMGVITEDPKEWVCHEYNFRFKHKDERYYLRGYNYLVDPYHQHRPYERATILSSSTDQIMKVDFIPISTGDDMHEEAWKLFHRLRNLVIYS